MDVEIGIEKPFDENGSYLHEVVYLEWFGIAVCQCKSTVLCEQL